MKNLMKNLTPNDIIVIAFYIFLSLLNVIFYSRIPNFIIHLLLNILVILTIFLLAKNKNKNKTLHIVHAWYVVPMIFLTFKEMYFMIYPIHQKDYDNILIQIDRFLLFGNDITKILYYLANPILTEILQIAYFSFYLIMIAVGAELRLKNRISEFHFAVFMIVYGFFLSYFGYFLLPAIGPRFTLHSFDNLNNELPGLFLTNILREIINSGESIPSGTLNPAMVVQRDVFPSGHTQMTLICMYLASKFNLKIKWIIYTLGILLIFATMYLRYHYLIDVLAGGVFFIFSIKTGWKLYNKLQASNGN